MGSNLKFPRICFRRTKCEIYQVLVCLLAFQFYIVTPGPALIRTVCNYSKLILITDNISAFRTFFSGDAVGNNLKQWFRNALRNMPHVFLSCLFMSNKKLDVLYSACFLLLLIWCLRVVVTLITDHDFFGVYLKWSDTGLIRKSELKQSLHKFTLFNLSILLKSTTSTEPRARAMLKRDQNKTLALIQKFQWLLAGYSRTFLFICKRQIRSRLE